MAGTQGVASGAAAVADGCPLCGDARPRPYAAVRGRHFLQCGVCQLVFVPGPEQLSIEQQHQRYLQHQNSAQHDGYRAHLDRLLQPLLARLPVAARGVDFGCGPGPVLAQLLEQHGHVMCVYDPFFAAIPAVLERSYDFVTCSEAIEHFAQPRREWQRLLGLLQPGGVLAIMTGLRDRVSDFAAWHYKNDPTHVNFYSRATFEWLAHRDGLTLELCDDPVVILRR